MVVDDARYVLDVVTDNLQCNGANVTAVDSAEEALDILQRERPDVLLSDLSMPGKGGYWFMGKPVGLGELIDVVATLALKEQPSGWLVEWHRPTSRRVGERDRLDPARAEGGLTSLGAARCAICSAELSDAAERFCGGDRCVRVFWSRAWLRPVSSHRGLCAGSSAAGPDSGADGESSLSEKEGGSL